MAGELEYLRHLFFASPLPVQVQRFGEAVADIGQSFDSWSIGKLISIGDPQHWESELRGDIALVRTNYEAARNYYQYASDQNRDDLGLLRKIYGTLELLGKRNAALAGA